MKHGGKDVACTGNGKRNMGGTSATGGNGWREDMARWKSSGCDDQDIPWKTERTVRCIANGVVKCTIKVTFEPGSRHLNRFASSDTVFISERWDKESGLRTLIDVHREDRIKDDIVVKNVPSGAS
ncbi:hypothetical protein WN48_01378 [Eufriesea mexicana]|uniref:Uncharacterized protein n=1 Tax=Eufriesea mexicana TaxID=516756 RepID=A0A310SGF6_9HYME|nr:hypothetical protein WN48_01378 [Eufriesea mexicana]